LANCKALLFAYLKKSQVSLGFKYLRKSQETILRHFVLCSDFL